MTRRTTITLEAKTQGSRIKADILALGAECGLRPARIFSGNPNIAGPLPLSNNFATTLDDVKEAFRDECNPTQERHLEKLLEEWTELAQPFLPVVERVFVDNNWVSRSLKPATLATDIGR